MLYSGTDLESYITNYTSIQKQSLHREGMPGKDVLDSNPKSLFRKTRLPIQFVNTPHGKLNLKL